jgi:hypothetical protein
MFPKRGFDFGKYSGLFFDELAHVIDLAARDSVRLNCIDMG